MNGGRRHVVLIPGFAGFDALGQLEYYAGVTPIFQHRPGAVLHYFDNFPTASVATRAGRLAAYLAKRIARGEIAGGDEVTLIGHSTGGLDIRWLVWHLHSRKTSILVDGGVEIPPEEILKPVSRVVFLSVPQWGTNIADWVRSHKVWREAVVGELRAAVCGSQLPLVDSLEHVLTGGAARVTGAGALRAVEDALSEADDRCGRHTPARTAGAHEAASELALYLRHMASDFSAIDDLASHRPGGEPASPAHFDERERAAEMKLWKGIETVSYVTRGRRPFPFPAGRPAPLWELSNPLSYPEAVKDCEMSAGTDIVYRTCYRACAGGPFKRPPGSPAPADIEIWDNDGIVNTASMFWPRGDNTLIEADHMDIVGHYRPVKAPPGNGREFQAYDLLGSATGFDFPQFRKIWDDIFDWAAAPFIPPLPPCPEAA
jgi:hypothetical protein